MKFYRSDFYWVFGGLQRLASFSDYRIWRPFAVCVWCLFFTFRGSVYAKWHRKEGREKLWLSHGRTSSELRSSTSHSSRPLCTFREPESVEARVLNVSLRVTGRASISQPNASSLQTSSGAFPSPAPDLNPSEPLSITHTPPDYKLSCTRTGQVAENPELWKACANGFFLKLIRGRCNFIQTAYLPHHILNMKLRYRYLTTHLLISLRGISYFLVHVFWLCCTMGVLDQCLAFRSGCLFLRVCSDVSMDRSENQVTCFQNLYAQWS